MVDPERLDRILGRITEDIAALRRDADADLRTDAGALRAVKYGFIVAVEGCTRAAHHIVASDGLGVPSSNADAIRMLARRGVLAADVTEPVARAVGFRNILVHEYAEVDDDIVRANVALLPDLTTFVAAVAAWSARQL